MKKFTFRLEKLLSIKKHIEKEAEIEYATLLQKRIKYENENKSFENDITKQYVTDFNKAATEKVNFIDLENSRNYIRALELKIEDNLKLKNELQSKLEEKLEKFKEATKERKILEKLKEKDHEKYKKELKKHEMKEIDDINSKLAFFGA